MRDFGDSSNDNWDGRGPESSENGIQIPDFLMDPLGILERRWSLMLAAVVLGLVATVYAVAQSSLTFASTATVLVTRQQISEKFVKDIVGDDSLANINAMVGKVLSQENLSKLIEKHDLYPEQRDLVPMSDLASRMRRSIDVTPQEALAERRRGESSVIYGITYENAVPEVAADVANSLAALLQEASIERRTRQATDTTSFLQGQLEVDEREFREVNQRISEFRKTHRGSLPDELQTNLRKLELLGRNRESLVMQMSEVENRLVGVGSGSLEMQLGEARALLSRETALYTDDHPNVQALKYQIERLERQILSRGPGEASRPEFGGMVQSGRNEIQSLKDHVMRIDREIAELNTRVDLTPAVTEELNAMEEKVAVLRENYHQSLNKLEQANVSRRMEEAQQGAQVQILDPATPSTSPKRSRRFMAFAGLLGSLGLALGLAIAVEIFDPVIVASDQLERIVGRPVLGSLPRLV